MNLLYIAHGGFGDVALTTAWPKLWTERGHTVDVFLIRYTGNPFYKNPYVRNLFIVSYSEAPVEISKVVDRNKYDKIVILENSEGGFGIVINNIKHLDNVIVMKSSSIKGDSFIPWYSKPDFYFDDQELSFIKENKLEDSVVFHPLSSSYNEDSRNISFSVIESCSKVLNNIVVTGGSRSSSGNYYTPAGLENLNNFPIKVLWENYNCFDDDKGSVLGKTFALVSNCKVSIHAWGGSNTIAIAYNKPMIIVVPRETLRANNSSPYYNSEELFRAQRDYFLQIYLKNPNAWCITDKAEDILDAVNLVLSGKSGIFNKTWTFFE